MQELQIEETSGHDGLVQNTRHLKKLKKVVLRKNYWE